MIAFLLGVPGKLKSLTDRLTATRAANLDYLNASISSTAPAITAVSNADYTAARAAKLSNIIENSVLNSNIQTGYANLGNTGTGASPDELYILDVTVSAVVIAKTVVDVKTSLRNTADGDVIGRMTTTTNLRLSGGANFMRCRWTLTEYK